MAKNSVILGVVVCCYATALYYVSVQMNIMQAQVGNLYQGTYMWAPQFLSGMQHETLKVLSSEIHSTEKPMSDVFMKTLFYSLEDNVQKFSSDFITVISNGFFPSNLMQTFQALLEYDFQLTAQSVGRTMGGVSNAYWYSHKSTGTYKYLTIGNVLQVVSQVAWSISAVTPLTQSTYIPPQDSWVGNFLTSIPNVTYNTFGDGDTWSRSFTNLSKVFANLGQARWSGTYSGPHGQQNHWTCYGCSGYFNDISKQAGIIALGPSLADAVLKPAHSPKHPHNHKHEETVDERAQLDHATLQTLSTMSNQGKPMEVVDSPPKTIFNATKTILEAHAVKEKARE